MITERKEAEDEDIGILSWWFGLDIYFLRL